MLGSSCNSVRRLTRLISIPNGVKLLLLAGIGLWVAERWTSVPVYAQDRGSPPASATNPTPGGGSSAGADDEGSGIDADAGTPRVERATNRFLPGWSVLRDGSGWSSP